VCNIVDDEHGYNGRKATDFCGKFAGFLRCHGEILWYITAVSPNKPIEGIRSRFESFE
jgi:hypothetical protein